MSIEPTRRSLLGAAMIAATAPIVPAIASATAAPAIPPLKTVRTDLPEIAYAAKFTGRYEHRLITGGIGHNLPQEAPAAFVDAMLDVARL
jgi:hypothetical protein